MSSDFEVLTEIVREQMGDDTIAFGIFRVAESRQASTRRVVWIPTAFRCEGVLEANALRDYDSGELGDTLLVDRLLVECHINGDSFEDACAIRRSVLNACRIALGTSSQAVDGEYVTEQEGKSGYVWGGRAKIVQRFEWAMNIAKPDTESVVVIEIDQTSELQNTGHTDEELVITSS